MTIKKLFLILFCFAFTNIYAQNKMTKTKEAIIASVENHKNNLIKISDDIWALAETAFEENKSAEISSKRMLRKQGFKVDTRRCRYAYSFCSNLWIRKTCN